MTESKLMVTTHVPEFLAGLWSFGITLLGNQWQCALV